MTPPTESEWLEYAELQDPEYPRDDALCAWNHYEANGWMVGRNKARNWKACLRTCYYRWKQQSAKQPTWKQGAVKPIRFVTQ